MSRVTEKQAQELRRLADKPDDAIDTRDIAEIAEWHTAERGRFYRPVKQQVTLRLDADLLAWFKAQGGRYQSRINAALREYVQNHRR